MNVIELSPEEYKKTVKAPFSVFDTVEFCQLNSAKVDSIKHLVFNNGKNRFGIIAGIKDGVLRAPFSAPYACFSEIGKNNKVASYSTIASSLLEYAKAQDLKKVRITFPPTVYDESHIARLYNSFYNAGFRISGCDLNFQYNLQCFGDDYEATIDLKARQKLRSAVRSELSFQKTDDIKTVYDVIRENRAAKNYPLWMTYENILETIKVIKADFFIVYSKAREPIASAMVYEVSSDKVQVIYWGNLPNTEDLKPMNFMAYHIFDYYSKKGKVFFDIGPSTEFSIPNFGLCDFKQAIGCATSSKLTFEADL
ncbi:hypothetical protein GGD92_07430 [Pseudomonas protegens]|uniref:Uncharacterized protein n=1 Tax=Pseudomonas protegens TaxID=380021 RepID=A0A7G8YQY7_9PSED|nr:hypothetical protein [Pseudomonas protegens]QNH78085.1 hypothetical protein GGI48_02505 [Pseudomonas protegens]QNL07281.1 hypothetical protein GGD92_07430 [Pseudomonas protegens]